MRRFFGSLRRAGSGFSTDQAQMMAAALAYYAVFSIAPLLVIALGLSALLLGPSAGDQVFGAVNRAVGPQGAGAIRSMVQSASSQPHAGGVATILGFVSLFFGASGVFQQLQQSLDNIWRVTIGAKASWFAYLRQRLLALGAVIGFGIVLLLSMAASTAVSAMGTALAGGSTFWLVVNYVVQLLILGTLFSAVFKTLPDVKLSWGEMLPGGMLTGLLFIGGNAAIAAYLSRTGVSSSYGMAGSLIVVLLWVFYSSQIVLFGAEFTKSYALYRGRAAPPKPGAVYTHPVTAADR